jgi:NAD/NADP transhydrogenase beta subunit
MLKFELIKNVLIVGIGAGIITTALVQKIKEGLKTKKYLILISFIVSMIIGTLFAKYFSDLSIVYCLWAGLFSFIGADILYKTFEDKIFTPFSKLNEVIEVPKENEIKGE